VVEGKYGNENVFPEIHPIRIGPRFPTAVNTENNPWAVPKLRRHEHKKILKDDAYLFALYLV